MAENCDQLKPVFDSQVGQRLHFLDTARVSRKHVVLLLTPSRCAGRVFFLVRFERKWICIFFSHFVHLAMSLSPTTPTASSTRSSRVSPLFSPADSSSSAGSVSHPAESKGGYSLEGKFAAHEQRQAKELEKEEPLLRCVPSFHQSIENAIQTSMDSNRFVVGAGRRSIDSRCIRFSTTRSGQCTSKRRRRSGRRRKSTFLAT